MISYDRPIAESRGQGFAGDCVGGKEGCDGVALPTVAEG